MAAPVFVTDDVPSADQINDWFVNSRWKRKAANLDRASTTTFADDTDLSVAVDANEVYEVRCSLLVHSSNVAAGDFKLKFTGPAGATLLATMFGYDTTATTVNTLVAGGLTLNTTGSFGTVPVTEPWNPVQINGVLAVSGTAGLFTLQWAQNVSSATVTRLQAQSFLCLNRRE